MSDLLTKYRKIGVRCYDAGEAMGDRYTVVFTGKYRHLTGHEQCYRSMSAYPFHPQGIGMWGSSPREIDRPSYKHLGKRIPFDQLPPDCQKLAMADAIDLAC